MEEKRRLPLWMIARKPLDPDTNNIITKEEVKLDTKPRKPKAKGVTQKHKKQVCPSSDEKSLLVKCETKRKKRGFVEKDVIECHDPEQKKKKHRRVRRQVEEPEPSRKKEEDKASSSDEEDEDLTMDDLLTIAKQIVENEKSDTGQKKPSEGLSLSKRNSSYKSSNTPEEITSPIQKETVLHHESTENTTNEVISSEFITTGDAAQDMLDLFLGPLLKKPIRKEETSFKDFIVPHEVKNQEHDDVVSNKPVWTKKKSSLRDAVAMLLD